MSRGLHVFSILLSLINLQVRKTFPLYEMSESLKWAGEGGLEPKEYTPHHWICPWDAMGIWMFFHLFIGLEVPQDPLGPPGPETEHL